MSNSKQSSVDKEFVTYTESLSLEELGFDEHCFAWYVSETYGLEFGSVIKEDLIRDAVLAPAFSQALRFFREKYRLFSAIIYRVDMEDASEYWDWLIKGEEVVYRHFKTYEEAELACLRKLIEIAKNKP
jgi:hypothetical protein